MDSRCVSGNNEKIERGNFQKTSSALPCVPVAYNLSQPPGEGNIDRLKKSSRLEKWNLGRKEKIQVNVHRFPRSNMRDLEDH